MQWSDLPLNPSNRTLKQFAGLWILFLGSLAAWQHAAHGRTRFALVLATLALTVGPIGLIFPRLLKPLFVTWLTLAFPIGWAVSRIILMVLFWGVITPMAMASRLFGRDVLNLRRRQATTYWTLKERSVDIDSYFRQF